MEKTIVTKDLEQKKLIIERSFDAPKAKVWQAYADKTWFESWWGPEGWQTTAKEFNFSPGGRLHYGMKCVDQNQGEWYGKESWGIMEIESIDEPNQFSAKDYFSDASGTINSEMPSLRFIVELIEHDGKTRLVTTTFADSAEQLEELIKMGMVEGFSSQLNKLEELVRA